MKRLLSELTAGARFRFEQSTDGVDRVFVVVTPLYECPYLGPSVVVDRAPHVPGEGFSVQVMNTLYVDVIPEGSIDRASQKGS